MGSCMIIPIPIQGDATAARTSAAARAVRSVLRGCWRRFRSPHHPRRPGCQGQRRAVQHHGQRGARARYDLERPVTTKERCTRVCVCAYLPVSTRRLKNPESASEHAASRPVVCRTRCRSSHPRGDGRPAGATALRTAPHRGRARYHRSVPLAAPGDRPEAQGRSVSRVRTHARHAHPVGPPGVLCALRGRPEPIRDDSGRAQDVVAV